MMKLLVQLEDEGHVFTLDLARLFELLHVELAEEDVMAKILQEVSRL